MADSTEDAKNLIRLEEESEGNSIGTIDFIFRKIGSSVPLKPSDSTFDFETTPSQAFAVSKQFGVLFLAHSEGFYVAKTKDAIELAKKIKEKGKGSGSIQELSIVDVTIGRVSMLALSTDSSALAACVGGEIHLFSVFSLINKEKQLYALGWVGVESRNHTKLDSAFYISAVHDSHNNGISASAFAQ